jgi:hypothetical protein
MRRLIFKKVDLVILYKQLNSLPEPPSIEEILIEGHPVIVVRVTEDMVQQCYLQGESVHMSRKLLKLGELMESQQEWRTSGFLAQLACCLYFYGDLKNFYSNLTVGHGDSGDLDIGNFKCDIKCRSTVYSGVNYGYVDIDVFKKHPYPLYILCSRAGDKILIWGYAWYCEVREWDESKQFLGDYEKDLTELHPIAELKALLLSE